MLTLSVMNAPRREIGAGFSTSAFLRDAVTPHSIPP